MLVWRAASQSESVPSERWLPAYFWSILVLFSKYIFQIKLWISNPSFRQKNLESGEKITEISCGYGVPERTFCAQFVGVGVCVSIEMQAEVITCQWFSTAISLTLPFPMSNLPLHHPVPPVSQRWVEGIKNGWICMYLCIVFPVLITSLQKWTTVKEEGKSMRHPYLADILKSALMEMFVLCFWESFRNTSIYIL